MPTTVPANPRFASAAERRVYEYLRAQLGEQDVIFAGQRVTDHRKDHEVDFVLAIEGAGIACLEVKGGEVWQDRKSTRLNSSHVAISYAVFCLKKKRNTEY